MQLIFLVCVAVGGTIMVAQFILSALGLINHGGVHFDVDTSGDLGGHHAVGGGVAEGGNHGHNVADGHSHEHSSTWYFGLITFQTLVVAITFFGLTGMVSSAAKLPTTLTMLISAASGMAAMFVVRDLMRLLGRMRSDGTIHIEGSVGQSGTVYLKIPGHRVGVGKVQFTLQDRLVEFAAVTNGDELPTGAKIVVVGVVSADTVAVEGVPAMVTSGR